MVEKKKPKRNITKEKIKKSSKTKLAKERSEKKELPVLQSSEKDKKEQIVYAKARYIPGSARKARLVVDLVRNMNAQDAIDKLTFIHKRASEPIRKVIRSAVSNAVANFEMEEKNLVIIKAYVDEAPVLKRGRAGSRGRYKKILKKNYHITIGIQEERKI